MHSSSPETRNLPRNEQVFRSLLQATVRNMFDDDEDHKDDSVSATNSAVMLQVHMSVMHRRFVPCRCC